ncbi:MAG: Ig-like domain repeat protein [Methanobacteriaceae archaeon]|nr:Ig-like domain repeat protein [Methanobacteriaceae archaeon]
MANIGIVTAVNNDTTETSYESVDNIQVNDNIQSKDAKSNSICDDVDSKDKNINTVVDNSKITNTDNKITNKEAKNKINTVITLKNTTANIQTTTKLTATVKDNNGNLVTTGKVAFKINGKTITKTNVSKGIATISYTVPSCAKNYNISVIYGENSKYSESQSNAILTVKKYATSMLLSVPSTSVGKTTTLTATVKDNNGNLVTTGKVAFKINGKTIKVVSVSKGVAKILFSVPTTAKNYEITAIYGENNKYLESQKNSILKVTKGSVYISFPNITVNTESTTKITATIKDNNGKLVTTGKVVFKLNGKTLGTATVTNGVASINYKVPNVVKTYLLTVKYAENNNYLTNSANATLTTNLKIYVQKWGSTGDITKNTAVYSNLVKSTITTNLINAAKTGTPYVKLGDGNGPTVFITAGVHGNELSSQIAAVKLINYLSKKTIHGTIYIFPFLIPSSIESNIRYYNGVDPNRVTNVAGTITNKVMNMAINAKAKAFIDCHSTKPGGVPGKTIVMGFYTPVSLSATLTNYIANKVGCAKGIYKIAAKSYPGALGDRCNLYGMAGVTCEVQCAHGTTNNIAINNSYNQMIAGIKYFNFI